MRKCERLGRNLTTVEAGNIHKDRRKGWLFQKPPDSCQPAALDPLDELS